MTNYHVSIAVADRRIVVQLCREIRRELRFISDHPATVAVHNALCETEFKTQNLIFQ